MARDQRPRQPRAEQTADARHAEGEAVLPGGEAELAEHQDREQRRGGHDQPVDQYVLKKSGAQRRVGEDVAPAVEQVARPQPRRRCVPARGSDPPIARMPERRQQVADGVGRHGRDRAETADRDAAERRAERGGGPGRGLEAAVGDEQVRGRARGLQVGAARRVERDVGRGHDDRRRPAVGRSVRRAEREGRGDAHQRGEADQIHRRPSPAACVGTPPTARAVPPPPRRPPAPGRQRRDRRRAGVQHQDRDQREGVEREPRAERADRVRGPQPAESSPQAAASKPPPRAAEQTTVATTIGCGSRRRQNLRRGRRRGPVPACRVAGAVAHPAGRLQARRRARAQRSACASSPARRGRPS